MLFDIRIVYICFYYIHMDFLIWKIFVESLNRSQSSCKRVARSRATWQISPGAYDTCHLFFILLMVQKSQATTVRMYGNPLNHGIFSISTGEFTGFLKQQLRMKPLLFPPGVDSGRSKTWRQRVGFQNNLHLYKPLHQWKLEGFLEDSSYIKDVPSLKLTSPLKMVVSNRNLVMSFVVVTGILGEPKCKHIHI